MEVMGFKERMLQKFPDIQFGNYKDHVDTVKKQKKAREIEAGVSTRTINAINKKNEQFQPTGGEEIDFVEGRWNKLTDEEAERVYSLLLVLIPKYRQFLKEYKKVFKFGEERPVSDIEFIHSHQRLPDAKNLVNILKDFNIKSINYIELAYVNGRLICYNGQHTLILLWKLGFKKVPVIIKQVDTVAEVRVLFREANGKGTHMKVSGVEDHRQDVLWFRTDGCTHKDAVAATQAQEVLEKNYMAFDGIGKAINCLPRRKELYDLKTKTKQQMFINCYKHRRDNGIAMDKYPGWGSKECGWYSHMITEGYTLTKINNITDFMYEHLGTHIAYAGADSIYPKVANSQGGMEPKNLFKYLKNHHKAELLEFGVKLKS